MSFERLLIAPVYGRHLEQILITIGGSIVIEQLLLALFGAEPLDLSPPAAFRGSLVFGEVGDREDTASSRSRSASWCSPCNSWCSAARASAC